MTQGALHITECIECVENAVVQYRYPELDQELPRSVRGSGALLPEVRASSECYGLTRDPAIGANIKITAIAGDQQASLFGQLCVNRAWQNALTARFIPGHEYRREENHVSHRLLTTIAWQIGDEIVYALEGSVFVGGAVIQWLRDELQVLDDAAESEHLALSVKG